jgi:phosphatidylinositol phospholipase C delta
MIYHGKTLTSKVSLRDICKAILKYAFVTSPYPLIISAEVHCSLHQQEKMVDIMIEEFGDKLIQAPVENRPKLEKLPSPEQLKHKILVKVRLIRLVLTPIAQHDILTLIGQERVHCRTTRRNESPT